MKKIIRALVAALSLASAYGVAMAADAQDVRNPEQILQADPTAAGKPASLLPPSVVAFTPGQLKWSADGLALAGMGQATLIGASNKAGPYTVRLKFPKGYKLEPHTHPDSRTITVLEGVWYTGYGKTYDRSKLVKLPAGSFYTEPANEPHFVEVGEEGALIQVSGNGPSARIWVEADHKH
jgi:quercetin dioxygenase-like cupin family protein